MDWAASSSTTLTDERVVLRPVAAADREPWRAIAMDSDIWRYFVVAIESAADFDAFFDAALADQQAGTRVV